MLEYAGVKASPLTKGFEYIGGVEQIPGVVKIEGRGKEPILGREAGSLAVVVFRVRKGSDEKAPLILYNLNGDICEAETVKSWFVRRKYMSFEEKMLILGESRKEGKILIVPVEVSDAFGVKAFGFEVKYSAEKITFIGVNPALLTRNFISVDGNEIEKGLVRVGGYSMSRIQERSSGKLVELMFQVKESGGKVEIIEAVDDLKDFVVIN